MGAQQPDGDRHRLRGGGEEPDGGKRGSRRSGAAPGAERDAEIRERIRTGAYLTPAAADALARRLLERGVV